MSSIKQCKIIVPTVQTVMTHLLTLLIPPLRILLQVEKTVWDGKSSELMKQLQFSPVWSGCLQEHQLMLQKYKVNHTIWAVVSGKGPGSNPGAFLCGVCVFFKDMN